MKFTIEVEDFYLDGEDSLEANLKDYIKRDVVSQIEKNIRTKVEDQIQREVHLEVEKTFVRKIRDAVTEIVGTEKIKGSNGVEITLSDYIKNKFQNNTDWRSPDDTIKALAKKFGDEMKARYDLLFASQIVQKLHENGLLKEDVAKKLLENNSK